LVQRGGGEGSPDASSTGRERKGPLFLQKKNIRKERSRPLGRGRSSGPIPNPPVTLKKKRSHKPNGKPPKSTPRPAGRGGVKSGHLAGASQKGKKGLAFVGLTPGGTL